MGKGKKKNANKGKKKRDDKKIENDQGVGDCFSHNITPEHLERARQAVVDRTEDPLKNWTRLKNEECPICMLPLPFNQNDTNYCFTCGKTVCKGCMCDTVKAHRRDGGDAETALEKAFTCPFCRSDTSKVNDKALDQEMKRANAGNVESMVRVGNYHFHGQKGLQQDKAEGLRWCHRAVEAGSGRAAFFIGRCYLIGDGVDEDHDKALEYYQKAADLGYIPAFAMIALFHMSMINGDIEEGMLNYRKAIMCGMSEDSLFVALRNGFKKGYITKDEYAFTLRENQKACNEMKSAGREEYKHM